jgi:hypothetical protein
MGPGRWRGREMELPAVWISTRARRRRRAPRGACSHVRTDRAPEPAARSRRRPVRRRGRRSARADRPRGRRHPPAPTGARDRGRARHRRGRRRQLRRAQVLAPAVGAALSISRRPGARARFRAAGARAGAARASLRLAAGAASGRGARVSGGDLFSCENKGARPGEADGGGARGDRAAAPRAAESGPGRGRVRARGRLVLT